MRGRHCPAHDQGQERQRCRGSKSTSHRQPEAAIVRLCTARSANRHDESGQEFQRACWVDTDALDEYRRISDHLGDPGDVERRDDEIPPGGAAERDHEFPVGDARPGADVHQTRWAIHLGKAQHRTADHLDRHPVAAKVRVQHLHRIGTFAHLGHEFVEERMRRRLRPCNIEEARDGCVDTALDGERRGQRLGSGIIRDG